MMRQTPIVNWLLVTALKDAKADCHREATEALIALLSDGAPGRGWVEGGGITVAAGTKG